MSEQTKPIRILAPATDGHQLPCYAAWPTDTPKAGLLILHEAFGVTPHIQRMADLYATHGYLAVAPEMLSRSQPEAAKRVLPYNKEGLDEGRRLITAITQQQWITDMAAAADWIRGQGVQKVGAVGYCWGGSLAYMSACKVPGIGAAVGYYGGMLKELVTLMKPQCPVLIHLATLDRYIPLEATREAFATHLPTVPVHIYDADHGFNRDDGITFNPTASTVALERSLAFLEANLG
jgi:carboxymethylenebutenolidase